jgi:hypothetical protein
MRNKPSTFLISGGIGLTLFGVAYDSGLFGPTDGSDHSAVFAVPGATGTVSPNSFGVTCSVVNNITGDVVGAPLPRAIKFSELG